MKEQVPNIINKRYSVQVTGIDQGKEVGSQPTMDKKSAPVLSKDQTAYVADTNRSTAARIKFLAEAGFSRADIARAMSAHSGKAVSYQWVKNVLDKVSNAAG